MGDTAPCAIGGAIAAMAIFTQDDLAACCLIGGIFWIEALSVIIQVISFKYFGGACS
jgi:phospho-N-acetylmuramoyl-pentapeptide-transferase